MEYLGFLPKILSAVSVGKAARRYCKHDEGNGSRNDKSTDSRNDTRTDSRNDKSIDSRNDKETSRRNKLLFEITRLMIRSAVAEVGGNLFETLFPDNPRCANKLGSIATWLAFDRALMLMVKKLGSFKDPILDMIRGNLKKYNCRYGDFANMSKPAPNGAKAGMAVATAYLIRPNYGYDVQPMTVAVATATGGKSADRPLRALQTKTLPDTHALSQLGSIFQILADVHGLSPRNASVVYVCIHKKEKIPGKTARRMVANKPSTAVLCFIDRWPSNPVVLFSSCTSVESTRAHSKKALKTNGWNKVVRGSSKKALSAKRLCKFVRVVSYLKV